MPLGPALHIAYEAAAALAYAHDLRDEKGKLLHVVHRDVSPANLLLTRRGRAKLTDSASPVAAPPRSGPTTATTPK